MNTILRLLKKMRSRPQPEPQPEPQIGYTSEFEYTVIQMAERLSCNNQRAIATVDAILAEGRLELSDIIHCLRYAHNIPVSDRELSQRLNTRHYQTGVFVGFGGFNRAGDRRPQACEGCCHYYGKSHGRDLLVCAMHPTGTDERTCGDWEAQEDA